MYFRKELTLLVKAQWEAGNSVLFHCNQGEVRGPAAAAIFCAKMNNVEAIDWLTTFSRGRQLAALHTTYMRELQAGNERWCPEDYDDYIIMCRLRDVQPRRRDFHHDLVEFNRQ